MASRGGGLTAEQAALAAVDSAHPAVIDRLCKDMLATAALLDAIDASSFAADGPWKALTTLRSAVELLFVEAEMHRDDTAKTYRPDVPRG